MRPSVVVFNWEIGGGGGGGGGALDALGFAGSIMKVMGIPDSFLLFCQVF